MNKINIKDLVLDIDILQLLSEKEKINSIKIDIYGEVYLNEENSINKPLIIVNNNINELSFENIESLAKTLFKDFRPKQVGTKIEIKPYINWHNIIELNKNDMLYYDHQSDGVEVFEDSVLEDYGWYASALEINYRAIATFIEDSCDGTLLFYDNEIQFNGFAIIEDINKVRTKVKEFIISQTKKNLENNLLELNDDDVIESLEYFEINED